MSISKRTSRLDADVERVIALLIGTDLLALSEDWRDRIGE